MKLFCTKTGQVPRHLKVLYRPHIPQSHDLQAVASNKMDVTPVIQHFSERVFFQGPKAHKLPTESSPYIINNNNNNNLAVVFNVWFREKV